MRRGGEAASSPDAIPPYARRRERAWPTSPWMNRKVTNARRTPMTNYRTWTGLVLGLSLGAFASYAAPDERGAEVVAEIGGQKLTRAALEQKQTGKLLQ